MSDPSAIPTILVEEHRRLGAHLAPFAGYLMPIRYGGIFDEHRAVRERAGIFDLSHMGQIELIGDEALAFVDHLSTNTLMSLRIGRARYSMLCQDDGGAIDDIIVYRLDDRILIVANGANWPRVLAHIKAHAPKTISVIHRDDRSLIALQGPRSAEILTPLVNVDLSTIANYAFAAAQFRSIDILTARTGYTGEDGFELFVPNDRAVEIFLTLLEAGKPYDILPAGLAARDVLRLEAGMPLYGNELSNTITPLQAGLDWAVRFDQGEFIGREALLKQKETSYQRIVGLKLHDRIPARAGYRVFADDAIVGEIRSATIAPSVGGSSIATALVDANQTEIGHTLSVEIRGTLYAAEVVSLPFYRRMREKAASAASS